MLSKFAPPNSSNDSDAVPRHSMLASGCLWGACGGSWLLVWAACGCSLLLVGCSWLLVGAACGALVDASGCLWAAWGAPGCLWGACGCSWMPPAACVELGVLVGPWAYMQPTPRRARHEDTQRGGQSCF